MNDIYSKFAGDEHWQEILQEFVAHLPQRFADLEKAIVENDFQKLLFLIHQLKGACGSYGFDQITPLAEQSEKALLKASSDNRVPEEILTFLAALQKLVHWCQPDARD